MAQAAETGLPEPHSTRNESQTEQAYVTRGPLRSGILIIDHQNLVGLCGKLGLPTVDPAWPLRMAQRVTNVESAVLVTDLRMTNPITQLPYIDEADVWSGHGYRIVHVPSKAQRIQDEQNGDVSRRKDRTEQGLRDEMTAWRKIPSVTDLLLLTHNMVLADEVQEAAWQDGKRVTLLTVGDLPISFSLKYHANSCANILDYAAAQSFAELARRGMLRADGNRAEVSKRISDMLECLDGTRRFAFLRRQLSDAKKIVRHLYESRLVKPDSSPKAQQYSWRLLRNHLHDFLKDEKQAAVTHSDESVEAAISDNPDRNSLEYYDRKLAVAQIRACQDSLDRLIEVMDRSEMLSYVAIAREGSSNHTRHFYLNEKHPTVQVLLGLDID